MFLCNTPKFSRPTAQLLRQNNCARRGQRRKQSTRAAPKVMPHIYFHGNYNRYKEHNNTI